MKRSFAYLVLALILSLLLCACGDTMEHGNITASPWPDVTTPVLPTPTAMISPSPIPDFNVGQENAEPDTSIGTGNEENTENNMVTNSPIPTDESR